jgi:hypothetical protein
MSMLKDLGRFATAIGAGGVARWLTPSSALTLQACISALSSSTNEITIHARISISVIDTPEPSAVTQSTPISPRGPLVL